jgi:predicted secreted Zn-dependent protease
MTRRVHRGIGGRLFVAALVASTVPPCVFAIDAPTPTIHDAVEYRDIVGNTENELVAGLRSNAASTGSNDRFAANTRWRLRWDFRVASDDGSCRVSAASVWLDVDMTLPRWTPPANAKHKLVKRWNAFDAALRKHENGHRDIAIAAANDVASRVAATKPASDCSALKKTLGAMADGVVRDYRDKEDSYDVTTQHGAVQGATFP